MDATRYTDAYSRTTGLLIDGAVQRLMDTAYQAASTLIAERADLVDAVARELHEKESLGYLDLKAILGPRPALRSIEVHQGEPPLPSDAASAEGGVGVEGGAVVDTATPKSAAAQRA